jgi:hypothetical protein
MKRLGSHGEQGQVLVYVAVSMLVLFGIIVFAIDVGHFYSERRRMQNAADAGALAGARELCAGKGTTAASNAAYSFAQALNLAPQATVNVATDAAGGGGNVKVTAWEPDPGSLFGSLMGQGSPNVGATAQATCGGACETCNLWPIAFTQANWNALGGGATCGKYFAIWSDQKPLDCGCYYCTLTGMAGGTPFTPMPEIARTWADFSSALTDPFSDPCDQSGGGDSELEDRIHGYDKKTHEACRTCASLGSCIGNDQGNKIAAWKAVEDAAGRTGLFPLFDPSQANKCGNNQLYFSGFGCGTVVAPVELQQQPTCKGGSAKERVVVMQVACADNPSCFSPTGSACAAGGGTSNGGVKAVSLTQ